MELTTETIGPVPAQTTPAVEGTAQALALFLILRAFAPGCTALTGVEAISNGIPTFRKPETDNAGKTLIAMAAPLATMFLGISILASSFQFPTSSRGGDV